MEKQESLSDSANSANSSKEGNVKLEPETTQRSFQAQEARDVARLDMDFFGQLSIPDVIIYQFADIFKVIWQLLTTALFDLEGVKRFAIGLPRGHGKSTVVKLLIAYAIIFSQRKFILIVCASEDLAENILSDVMDILTEMNIISLFGDWRHHRVDTETKTKKVFYFRGRPIIIQAVGFNSSTRGLNIKHARPDFMIFDDAQTRECALNPTLAKEFREKLYGTWLKLKAASCVQIWVGNMYRDVYDEQKRPCCMLRAMQRDSNWVSFITGAILADNNALFPELYSVEALLDDLSTDMAAGMEDVWFSEVQNDPEAQSLKIIDFSRIIKKTDADLLICEGACIIIDPATDKLDSDDQIITQVEWHGATPVVCRVVIENGTPKALIKKALELCLLYSIPLIAVENVNYQHSLMFWFNEYMENLGITGITVVPIAPKGVPKNTRILQMFRQLIKGEIHLHERTFSQITNQIDQFDPSIKTNKDDILDTIAYIDQVQNEYKLEKTSPILLQAMAYAEEGTAATEDIGYSNNNILGLINHG